LPQQLLVAFLVLYLVTFSLSGGTVTIATPVTVSGVATFGSYVALLNVSYPIATPVLAILPVNASVRLYLNSTFITIVINSSGNWSVSIWSVPSPVSVYGNASYVYDPLYGNVTLSGYGNQTVAIYSPNLAPASVGGATTIVISSPATTYVGKPITESYTIDVVAATLLSAAAIACVLLPMPWRRRVVLTISVFTITVVMYVARQVIVVGYHLVSGKWVPVYSSNPMARIYIAPLALSILALIYVVVMRSIKRMVEVVEV